MLKLFQHVADVTSGDAGMEFNCKGSGIEMAIRTGRSYGTKRAIGAKRDWSQSTTGDYKPGFLPLSNREFYAWFDEREPNIEDNPAVMKKKVMSRFKDADDDSQTYMNFGLFMANSAYMTDPSAQTQSDLIGLASVDRGASGAVTDLTRSAVSGAKYATLEMNAITSLRPDGTSQYIWRPAFVHLPSSGNDAFATKPIQTIRRAQTSVRAKHGGNMNPDFGMLSDGMYEALVNGISINGQIPVSNNASGGYLSKIGANRVISIDGTEVTSATELSTGTNSNAGWRGFLAYGDCMNLQSWNPQLMKVRSFYDPDTGCYRWVSEWLGQVAWDLAGLAFFKQYEEA